MLVVAVTTAGWVISGLAILTALAIVISLERRARAEKRIEHERVLGEASAHRERANAGLSRARELGEEADAHRAEAERHARAADEHAAAAQDHAEKASALEREVGTATEGAARHDEEAAKREDELA